MTAKEYKSSIEGKKAEAIRRLDDAEQNKKNAELLLEKFNRQIDYYSGYMKALEDLENGPSNPDGEA